MPTMLLVSTILFGCNNPNTSSQNSNYSVESEQFSISLETPISSETPSSSNSISSETSTSIDNGPLRLIGIKIADSFANYYVGETFNDVENISVEVQFSNKEELDVSGKLNYYDLIMKDETGKSFDFTKPFVKTGKYTLTAHYKRDHAIASNPLEINVTDVNLAKITTKSPATSVFNYSDLENSLRQNYSFPTIGNLDVLVIPVEFSDFPFRSSPYGADTIDALDRAFNGDGAKDTGYWESVASFNKKSSLGQLNFNFEIAPIFKTTMTTTQALNLYFGSADYYTSLYFAKSAIDNYKMVHGPDSTMRFDYDNDGFIDGVWFVYSSPHYGHYAYDHLNAGVFWAFCTDAYDTIPSTFSPTLASYSWASISFLTTEVDAPNIDAHTFIHETGHLLGLPDYYSYDYSYGPQGGLTMMDMNIGDYDAFSKIALGWVDPYVVSEDAIVTIKPNNETGEAVLLADHWNGTAFDEYILLDLQVPTGVNELDATASYSGYSPLYYSIPGVRMYHVDARLNELKYLFEGEEDVDADGVYVMMDETKQNDYYLADDQVRDLLNLAQLPRISYDRSLPVNARPSAFTVVNSNSPSRSVLGDEPYVNNRLLSLIGADNTKPDFTNAYATNKSLFQVGDSWSMSKKGHIFFTNNMLHFNNGDKFSWVITILECSTEEATILVRKITTNKSEN